MKKERIKGGKKEMITQMDGVNIYHVLGLEESILSKWIYYPWESTD